MFEISQKRSKKDNNYYISILTNELRIYYEVYITKYTNFRFKDLFGYLFYVLQTNTEKIMKYNPELKKRFYF